MDIAGARERHEDAAAEPRGTPLIVPLPKPAPAHDGTRPMYGLRPPVFDGALLPFRTCQWIEGEPTRHAVTCGRRSLPGLSWCRAHAARVFRDASAGR